MTAPVSISIDVDRDEYSRFEVERNTIYATIAPSGFNLLNEELLIELIKARRGRDEVVAIKTLTLNDNVTNSYLESFKLTDIVDAEGVPKLRRGRYFIKVSSITDDSVTVNSQEFNVSLISVSRLKDDYLHGTDQMASDTLFVRDQPSEITGVYVDEVSRAHPTTWYPLSYNFSVDRSIYVESTSTQNYTLSNGQTLVIHLDGTGPQTVTFTTGDFSSIAAATIAELKTVIEAAVPGVIVTNSSNKLRITGGLLSIFIDPIGSATIGLGLGGKYDTVVPTRTLSWCNGPVSVLDPSKKTYTLRRSDSTDYIRVRVPSLLNTPNTSTAEELLIERKPFNEDRLRNIVDQSISWVEDALMGMYVEPTIIVTEVDPNVVSYGAGTDIPTFVGADWDEVVDAVTYQSPSAGHWLNVKFPYYPIIRFEELFGKIANTRIVDIALEWIEAHEKGGFVELVPFNQEVAFNFLGLVWVESLRGTTPLPNFWNFTALVGFRDTPPILIELIAKKAAIDILTIAGQAYRGGISSQSVSRDGISESVSYTSSATAGIYNATINEYKTWINENLQRLIGAFRGVTMTVM